MKLSKEAGVRYKEIINAIQEGLHKSDVIKLIGSYNSLFEDQINNINRGWVRSPRVEYDIAIQAIDLLLEMNEIDNKKFWNLLVSTNNELYLRGAKNGKFGPTRLQRQVWNSRKKKMKNQDKIIVERLQETIQIYSEETQQKIISYAKHLNKKTK